MKELALQVRTFVYTMILFQCLIQLAQGSSFYRYLKLFSQLLAIVICCNLFFTFFGIVDDGWEQADTIYEQWEAQWRGGQELADTQGYLASRIMEKSVEEWKVQVAELLDTEGKGKYELRDIAQKEDGVWELMLGRKMGAEASGEFPPKFAQAVCRRFSMQEEQVEVRIQ